MGFTLEAAAGRTSPKPYVWRGAAHVGRPGVSPLAIDRRPSGAICNATARLSHQLAELLEQIAAVVRAGRRLGVVLHAEQRAAPVPHPLEGLVVEVDVRRLPGRAAASSMRTAKPWFCVVISTLLVRWLSTGWLAPRWPNFSLNVLPPRARPQQLVAQADAEHRLLAGQAGGWSRWRSPAAPGRRGRWTERCRRACCASTSSAVAVPGKHRHLAADLHQTAQDVVLHAEVEGDDVVRRPAATADRSPADW